MRALLLAGAILLAPIPAIADDAMCIAPSRTVADDKAVSEAEGFKYLGIRPMPFSVASAVFYTRDGETFWSLMIEGCVSPAAHDIGPYVAEPDV